MGKGEWDGGVGMCMKNEKENVGIYKFNGFIWVMFLLSNFILCLYYIYLKKIVLDILLYFVFIFVLLFINLYM